MKTLVKKETDALNRISERHHSPLMIDKYICIYRARRNDELLPYVTVDSYQLMRDHRGLPDAIRGLGRHNWNVDKWESEMRVVHWGCITSRQQFRQILLAAREELRNRQVWAERIYPEGRREWVIRDCASAFGRHASIN
ncbi:MULTISPECIES: hypothetical protein [unclassified Pantoea]|uniref:hypothetical protein n=1 Tax=unclassified Pantoea TaxID=2630326 RepID=UPI0012320B79|nr:MULTISPECIES: hypothetical protein [unclassified Pantoea]KAA5957781.1 hypothetical protein F3I53_16150 [Pantoea sp. VH_16]KAA6104661.1 hypothetical protein F3I25_16300 [Pantoea sp. Bo_14]KAA6108037.1 hypothetical protein F3I23_15335 [Pantoea sp. Bo_11]